MLPDKFAITETQKKEIEKQGKSLWEIADGMHKYATARDEAFEIYKEHINTSHSLSHEDVKTFYRLQKDFYCTTAEFCGELVRDGEYDFTMESMISFLKKSEDKYRRQCEEIIGICRVAGLKVSGIVK